MGMLPIAYCSTAKFSRDSPLYPSAAPCAHMSHHDQDVACSCQVDAKHPRSSLPSVPSTHLPTALTRPHHTLSPLYLSHPPHVPPMSHHDEDVAGGCQVDAHCTAAHGQQEHRRGRVLLERLDGLWGGRIGKEARLKARSNVSATSLMRGKDKYQCNPSDIIQNN